MAEGIKTLADDLERLSEIRMGLREELRLSALFNPVVHVREMEETLYPSCRRTSVLLKIHRLG